MLQSVTDPKNKQTTFEYDALGRRTAKIVIDRFSELVTEFSKKGSITRFVWDGNVPLHEWKYNLNGRPKLAVDDYGMLTESKPEPIENLITWVFDEGTFKPSAKITATNTYSIITDYLGTPVEMYNSKGEKTWSVEYDIYGKVRKLVSGSLEDCPFRYQGQYEDPETGLYYNRFRYYAPDEGVYISQDPIGLFGMNPTMYAYVSDSNKFIDVFGLNVQTGANRTHVKYSGIKDGKPYHGYASAPTSDGLTDQQIIDRRYGSNFDDFDVDPTPDYIGEGVEGKRTARGLEQRGFEADGGLDGTANKQNPVGPNNQNRQKYLDAADSHQKAKVKAGC